MSRQWEDEFRESLNVLHFREDTKDRMHNRILLSQNQVLNRKDKAMKKWTVKNAAAVAAVCVMITGITVFAAARISYYTAFSRSEYDYKTAAEMNKQNHKNYPALPEALGDEFRFSGGKVVHIHTEGKDDSGSTVGKWEDLSAQYSGPSGNTIILSLTTNPDAGEIREATEVKTIAGTRVRYDRDEYLVLPDENYELDEEMRNRLEKDEHFFVSYGSEKQETVIYQFISFEKDGITYTLYTSSSIDSEILFRMAAELIG